MPPSKLPQHVRQRVAQRDMRLQTLGYLTYVAYLRSPHWCDVRRAYRTSALPQQCVLCDDEDVQLHHTTYERIGAEQLTDLVPLCSDCHHTIHALERQGQIGLDFAGLENPMRAFLYRVQNMDREQRAQDEAPESLEARVLARRKEKWRRRRQRQRLKARLRANGYL